MLDRWIFVQEYLFTIIVAGSIGMYHTYTRDYSACYIEADSTKDPFCVLISGSPTRDGICPCMP